MQRPREERENHTISVSGSQITRLDNKSKMFGHIIANPLSSLFFCLSVRPRAHTLSLKGLKKVDEESNPLSSDMLSSLIRY